MRAASRRKVQWAYNFKPSVRVLTQMRYNLRWCSCHSRQVGPQPATIALDRPLCLHHLLGCWYEPSCECTSQISDPYSEAEPQQQGCESSSAAGAYESTPYALSRRGPYAASSGSSLSQRTGYLLSVQETTSEAMTAIELWLASVDHQPSLAVMRGHLQQELPLLLRCSETKPTQIPKPDSCHLVCLEGDMT